MFLIYDFQSRFPNEDACIQYLIDYRWPKGYRCHKCKSKKSSYYPTRHHFQCNNCKHQQSVTAGTIFEKSSIPLTEWFEALFILRDRDPLSKRSFPHRDGKDKIQKQRYRRMHSKLIAAFEQGDDICGLVKLFEIVKPEYWMRKQATVKKHFKYITVKPNLAQKFRDEFEYRVFKTYIKAKTFYKELIVYQDRLGLDLEKHGIINITNYSEAKKETLISKLKSAGMIITYKKIPLKTEYISVPVAELKKNYVKQRFKEHRVAQTEQREKDKYDPALLFPTPRGRKWKKSLIERLNLTKKQLEHLDTLLGCLSCRSNPITVSLQHFEYHEKHIPYRTLDKILSKLEAIQVIKLFRGANIPTGDNTYKREKTKIVVNPKLFPMLRKELDNLQKEKLVIRQTDSW